MPSASVKAWARVERGDAGAAAVSETDSAVGAETKAAQAAAAAAAAKAALAMAATSPAVEGGQGTGA